MTATVASYPIQVLKTKLQATDKRPSRQNPRDDGPSNSNIRAEGKHDIGFVANLATVIYDIYSQHGLRGFYLGLDAKLVQTALTAAILFVCRDAIHHRVAGVG